MAVKLKKGLPKIVTANDLKNGLAVFLKADGSWTGDVNQSAVVTSDEDMDNLLKKGEEAEAANIVIGPYLVDIEQDGDKIKPVHLREYMRATGPSVREDIWNSAV
ncbi:MAG: DUF2849 domain-containing protein [Methyloligellaceae bacterium]